MQPRAVVVARSSQQLLGNHTVKTAQKTYLGLSYLRVFARVNNTTAQSWEHYQWEHY